MVSHHILEIVTRGKGLYPFTRAVAQWLSSSKVSVGSKADGSKAGGSKADGPNTSDGLLTIFIQHTSASLTIQENADPDVVLDLADFFERLVPEEGAADGPPYRHTTEGPDDMAAHIRTALTQTSLSIPVIQGRMALGTWQGLYLFEHRVEPQRRRLVLQVLS